MSTKDSAEDKLIASIQKTKAQAGKQSEAPSPDAVNKAATQKVVQKKAAPKKAATQKAAPKKAAAKKPGSKGVASARNSSESTQSGKAALIGMFNRGRRVWPD